MPPRVSFNLSPSWREDWGEIPILTFMQPQRSRHGKRTLRGRATELRGRTLVQNKQARKPRHLR